MFRRKLNGVKRCCYAQCEEMLKVTIVEAKDKYQQCYFYWWACEEVYTYREVYKGDVYLPKERYIKRISKETENVKYDLRERKILMLECDYEVKRIDGDYAHLQRIDRPEEELKLVARALLPMEIYEGCILHYEMMQYSMK